MGTISKYGEAGAGAIDRDVAQCREGFSSGQAFALRKISGLGSIISPLRREDALLAKNTRLGQGPGWAGLLSVHYLLPLDDLRRDRDLAFVYDGGDVISACAWPPVMLVIGSVLAFALLIYIAGLVAAIVGMMLLSAAASEKFRFEWKATVGLVSLIALCSLVFVKGLGVPILRES